MKFKDTIVAIVTPLGKGSIGVIRVSGSLVEHASYKILHLLPEERKAVYLPFFDDKNNVIDYGISIYFKSPKSLTGEDVLELHSHGNPVILNLILSIILKIKNVRLANPGEFLERSFLNNKISLVQAESIADLIEANSIESVKAAINSINGMFLSYIEKIINKINKIQSYVESSIDFVDEIIEFSKANVINLVQSLIKFTKKLLNKIEYNSLLQKKIKIVMIGQPNVGKSSLINALTDCDVSIVTNIPGTTRDILKKSIFINNFSFEIVDTAGLRNPNNEIEKIGIKKTLYELNQANYILVVIDGSKMSLYNQDIWINEIIKKQKINKKLCIVRNKSDLSKESIGVIKGKNFNIINVSAKKTLGIDILKQHIFHDICNFSKEDFFTTRKRHIILLKKSYLHIKRCNYYLSSDNLMIEFIAEELRHARKYLYEIIGIYQPPNVINRIFSKFCIGK